MPYGIPEWLSGIGTFGGPTTAAPTPLPPGSLAKRVKTTPVDPSTFPTIGGQGAPQASTQPADEGQRARLMKMYMDRMEGLNKPAAEETTKDKIARMLINFGQGTSAGASNIRGRKVGPSTLEAFGAGTSSLAKGEAEERDRLRGLETKRGDDSTSMLEKALGYHTALDKEQREKANTAFDRYYKKRGLDIKEKKSSNYLRDSLMRGIPSMINNGASPEEVMEQIRQVLTAADSNPEIKKMLGID